MKKKFVISATVTGLTLTLSVSAHAQQQAPAASAKAAASPTREQSVISTAGARGMIDACEEYAIAHHHNSLSMVVIDWGGNIIEAHAMEGSVPNNTDTALLKAKNALRWRRPQSETNAELKPDHFGPAQFVPEAFPIPGGLPIVINGEVIGAMGRVLTGRRRGMHQVRDGQGIPWTSDRYGTSPTGNNARRNIA